MNNPSRIVIAPGGPAIRILTRSDDVQIRLTYLGNLEGLDVRLFRKSPAEASTDLDAFHPTQAGLVIPRAQLQDFAGLLAEIIAELDR